MRKSWLWGNAVTLATLVMAVTAIVALIYTHLQIAESRRAPAGGQRQRTVARNSEAWLCIDKRLLIATKRVHQLGSYFLRERIRTRRPLSGLQLSSFRRKLQVSADADEAFQRMLERMDERDKAERVARGETVGE